MKQKVIHEFDKEIGLDALVARGERSFFRLYGSDPFIFAKGSCRIEGFGGNFTDQGFGLHANGFATNVGIIAAVGKRDDRMVRIWSEVNSEESPIQLDLDNLPTVADTSHWSHYEVSILRQLQMYLTKDKYKQLIGANICFVANVPPGTAISTSAAVEASFLHGFAGVNHLTLPERQIVRLTKIAENAIGSSCGILDQATSNTVVSPGYGVLLRFIDGGDGVLYTSNPTYMDLEKHGVQIVVIFAKGVERNLAGTDYGRKARLIQEGGKKIAELLHKDVYQISIADVEQQYVQLATMDEEMAKAVRHVYSDNERVLKATALLHSLKDIMPYTVESSSVLMELGNILNESAKSSIEQYGVATGIPDIKTFAPLLSVMRDCGALGARNEGGGGIPTSIALINRDTLEAFSKEVPQKLGVLFPHMQFEVVPISLGKASRVLK